MSIDKTTLNRIRIAIQHAFCTYTGDDYNYDSMAKGCVDLGIIEKAEDFDTETFTHAPILLEKIWERVGDSRYKTPLELFEAWAKDEVTIYRLGEEIEDWDDFYISSKAIMNLLSGIKSLTDFVFVGKAFVKMYKDRSIHELNEMQREAFEFMQEYDKQKKDHELAMALGAAKIFGRKADKTHKTKEGRKFIKMYDPESGEYIGPLLKPMTHEEAHGKKEPVDVIKVDFNKEAWDKLKYEHDIDQPHFKLAGAALFNHDKGVFEVRLENDNDVKQIVDISNSLSELPKDIGESTKNSAEIFCRITDKGYMSFNRYADKLHNMSAKESLKLPFVVDEAVRKVNLISELADLELNVILLVYAVYKAKYEPAKYPYGASDIIFDIVDAAIELKKEGMIQ